MEETKTKVEVEKEETKVGVEDLAEKVFGDLEKDLEAGNVVEEETSALESAAYNVMAVLSKVPNAFKRVMNTKPQKAYEVAAKALDNVAILCEDDEDEAEEVQEALQIMAVIKDCSLSLGERVKIVFGYYLVNAAKLIKKGVRFTGKTTIILATFVARMVGHTYTEGVCAVKAINKAFKDEFLN